MGHGGGGVSEIDSQTFSLPVAEARGLQSGGTSVFMGSGIGGRLHPTRLRLFQRATSGRRQRLAGRRARGLRRWELGRGDLFGINPRHEGVPNLQGGRVPAHDAAPL